MKFLLNFWDGFCQNDVKCLCIASHLHYNHISCILDVCLFYCNDCVPIGLDQAEPMMYLSLHVICSSIFMHTYLHFFIFLYTAVVVTFLIVSLSLSFLHQFILWHLNLNLLHPRTLCILGHLLFLILPLLLYSSVMINPERTFQRTFPGKTFIRNATSFCRTFPTLTFPLSYIVRVGGHYVTS